MNPSTALRIVAIAEATSFLALLVAAYLKRQDAGELGVQVLGPIHGLLFLAFVALVFVVRAVLGWRTRTTLLVLLGAVVPFGGYFVEGLLRRSPATDP